MMKRNIFALLVFVLAGCSADLSQYAQVDTNASYKTRLKACLISEANTKLQSGTLFNESVITTAKELAGSCIKSLALQSAGIEAESQTMAQNIIQNLKNITTK